MDRGRGRRSGRVKRSLVNTSKVTSLACLSGRTGFALLLVCLVASLTAVAQQPQSSTPAAQSTPALQQSSSAADAPSASAAPQNSSEAPPPKADAEKSEASTSDKQKTEASASSAANSDPAKTPQKKEAIQDSFDEVHVRPVKPEEKPAEKPTENTAAAGSKTGSLGNMTGIGAVPSNSALKAAKTMHVDVNLVLVPVTITDEMNRLVTGLERDNFVVTENGERQAIRHFSSEDAPVSLGVIFDMSGSMKDKMERAKEAVVEFFKTANPDDEFFMIAFNEKPEVISDFTNSVEQIQSDLVYALPKGRTALLDAIYLGLAKMRQARNQKKALLIVSDGGDNHSRYTENEIKSLVREADVQIYAIGIFSPNPGAPEEVAGPVTLSEITDETGGRTFTIDNPNELSDVATKIGIELRNQYVLGYRPTKPVRDGKWRKIKVKLNPPKGLPPLTVHSKTGYYAPTE